MSRDLTPKELDYLITTTNTPNLTDTLVIQIGDKVMPAYNDTQKEMSHRYPKLGKFGFDMLNSCFKMGIYSSEDGKQLLQKVEDYFNGENINDKELAEAAQQWYEGTFCPGYYMNDNNSEFATYLKSRISIKILRD